VQRAPAVRRALCRHDQRWCHLVRVFVAGVRFAAHASARSEICRVTGRRLTPRSSRRGHRLGGVLRLLQQHLARSGQQLGRPGLHPGALQDAGRLGGPAGLRRRRRRRLRLRAPGGAGRGGGAVAGPSTPSASTPSPRWRPLPRPPPRPSSAWTRPWRWPGIRVPAGLTSAAGPGWPASQPKSAGAASMVLPPPLEPERVSAGAAAGSPHIRGRRVRQSGVRHRPRPPPVRGDTNGSFDVFVHDPQLGRLRVGIGARSGSLSLAGKAC